MLKESFEIHNVDCLEGMRQLPDGCVDLVVTSPPYNNWRNLRTQASRQKVWQRTNIVYDNYDDKMPDEDYQSWQVEVLNECLRVLKPTGTICYNHKDRIFEFECLSPLTWILKSKAVFRQRVTWNRRGGQNINPVRFFRCEEDIYILGREAKGFKWNPEASRYMSVWDIQPASKQEADHPAPFPPELVRRCVEAFTEPGDVVLDPFAGSGTTLFAAQALHRQVIGMEISPKYCEAIRQKKRDMESFLGQFSEGGFGA